MWFLDEVAFGSNRAQNLKATSPKINCAAIHSAQQTVKTSKEKLYILGPDSDYLIGCSAFCRKVSAKRVLPCSTRAFFWLRNWTVPGYSSGPRSGV